MITTGNLILTQVPRGLLFLSSMTKPDPGVPSVAFLKFEDGSIIGTPSSSYGVMLPLLSPEQNQSLKENLREVQTFLRF